MSGGKLDYMPFYLERIADEIQKVIKKNTVQPDWINDEDWDGQRYSDETIAEFKNALEYLRKAYVYSHRIEWLLSGDDGEEEFHKRLKSDLENLRWEEPYEEEEEDET